MERLSYVITGHCTLQNTLIAVLVLTLAVFVGVLFFDSFETKVSEHLGVSEKSEILKFVGIAMGGILIALQAHASNRRAKAMEDRTVSAEQGLLQERMKNAIEHLGHVSESVRLGGAYELVHLADDTAALRQTVLDILCAHIRQTTGEDEYRKEQKSKPSEEVQSLLTLLFVKNHEIFRGLHVNLKESYLNGADVREAHMEKADLASAHLQGTIFYKAHLQRANFREAHLQGADLFQAQLQGVCGSRAPHRFADRMRNQIGKKTELHDVIFAGDLSREQVDSFAKDLPDEGAEKLRGKLQPHIGQPKREELPAGYSEAVTGAYTVKEADKWIAVYEEAMSGIPEEER